MRKLLLLLAVVLIAPVQAEVRSLDSAQFEKLIAQGVPVIDIRRAQEWQQTGVVKGSHLITFFDQQGHYDVKRWLARLQPIAGKNDPFILICRTGNRTGIVSKFLDQKLGYTQVSHVAGGITQWIKDGKPVVKP